MFWINHPRTKKPDAMLSVAIYSTVVVLGKFLLNGVEAFGINFGSTDAMLIAAILSPTLGAYVFRKQKSPPESEKKNEG